MQKRLLMVCGVLLCLASGPVMAQKYYTPDIENIISAHGCDNCHGGSGGMFITPYMNLMTTGDHAPVVVANDSNSIIVKKLKGTASFGARMPFGGPYLTATEINIVVQWIMGGAKEKATAVPDEVAALPSDFALDQNFPNPFNPATTIRFVVPFESAVRLSVIDPLGREVALLVNERKPAGRHEVHFDAAGLASGVYLYRLASASFTQTRKMVIAR